MSLYRDGDLWVAVETGMPQDNVRIGIGETADEAQTSLEETPIQSVGRDSGESSAIAWAKGAGWLTGPLEEIDGE